MICRNILHPINKDQGSFYSRIPWPGISPREFNGIAPTLGEGKPTGRDLVFGNYPESAWAPVTWPGRGWKAALVRSS